MIVSLEWCPISCMVNLAITMNIRTIGVKHMRNNPEKFIETSTDNSWLTYLAYMSHQATWADALVIQAVADALNMTIHIIESDTDTTVTTIGHLDEIHYVTTVPFNEEAMACNAICNNQPAYVYT